MVSFQAGAVLKRSRTQVLCNKTDGKLHLERRGVRRGKQQGRNLRPGTERVRVIEAPGRIRTYQRFPPYASTCD
jgi:hypothetical protein